MSPNEAAAKGENEAAIKALVEWVCDELEAETSVDLSDNDDALTRIWQIAADVHAAWRVNPNAPRTIDVPHIAELGGYTFDFHRTLTPARLQDVFEERADAPIEEEEQQEEEQPAPKATQEPAPKPGQSGVLGWAMFAGLFAVGVSGALLWHRFLDSPEREPEVHKASKDLHPVTTASELPAATASIYYPTMADIPVPSCKCVSRAGAAKNTFALQAPPPVGLSDSWWFKWQQQTGMSDLNSGFHPQQSKGGVAAVLPPQEGTTKVRAAIACEGDIVALVSGNVASGWSGNDGGELIWNTKLPSALADGDAGAPAPTNTSGVPSFDVACTRELAVFAGAVTLDMVNGKRVALSMRDGTLH
jgi:hypothetical protein